MDTRKIVFDLAIDHCKIDLKRAVSLGLIINELVTDSLKYAFPDGRTGRIRVRFERWATNLRLEFADNGIGLPSDFELEKSKGFGLNLIAMLVKQLDAELFIGRGTAGVQFDLSLPLAEWWTGEKA
jgi:two-component sensor histidine kinase